MPALGYTGPYMSCIVLACPSGGFADEERMHVKKYTSPQPIVKYDCRPESTVCFCDGSGMGRDRLP